MSIHALHPGLAGRQLGSWIDGFLEYTSSIWSGDLHRKWAAISMLAGTLERKVWIRSLGANLFPHLYVFLVGPPAVGKTWPINVGLDLWKDALKDSHHLGAVSLTKASLMDELAAAVRVDNRLENFGLPGSFNTLTIASTELGALIPAYDPAFLNALTDIYDGARYSEKRRSTNLSISIENPQINLIGATTPSFLMDTLPPSAWDQGFLSRVIIVYKDFITTRRLDLSEESNKLPPGLRTALVNDMKIIGGYHGKMAFSAEARARIEAWYDTHEDEPSHPKLLHYNSRRPTHVLKLAMIAAADSGSMTISLDDAEAAIGWLKDVEKEMPNLFVSFSTGGDAAVISDAHHYLLSATIRSGKPIPMHFAFEYIQGRVPAYRVWSIIEVMIKSGLCRLEENGGMQSLHVNPKRVGL